MAIRHEGSPHGGQTKAYGDGARMGRGIGEDPKVIKVIRDREVGERRRLRREAKAKQKDGLSATPTK